MTSSPQKSLQQQVDVLLSRWWLIAGSAVLTLVVVLLATMSVTPVYQASATIVVDRVGTSLGLVPDIVFSQQTFVDTLAEILKSRAVAQRALDRLGVTPADRGKVLSRLQSGVGVQRVRGADLIRVSAQGSTPQAAAAAANAVVEAFLDWHIDARRTQASAGREFIETQLVAVRRELRSTEDALAQYKATGGQVVSLTDQTALAVTKAADFEAQRRATTASVRATQTSLARAKTLLREQVPTVPASFVTEENPVIRQLRAELARLEVELAGLTVQFTERHPQVLATRARIDDIRSRLQREAALTLASRTVTINPLHRDLVQRIISLEVDLTTLQSREAALADVVSRYVEELRRLPPQEVQLARLTRNLRVAEQTYLLLSGKLQEARIAEASIVGDLRIVDRAVAPQVPVRPQPRLNALLGLIAGLMLGIGTAYVLEAVDVTFKDPEEVARILELPLLAMIPVWRERTSKGEKRRFPLAFVADRGSPFAEAFRQLRTNLLYFSPDRPLRTVLVTSPGPAEGKGVVASNLAIAFAQLNRRVWLVECDLRKPSLAWIWQPKAATGLSDYLVDGLPLDRVVQPTEVENLWLIPGGTRPPNPGELLGSKKMQSFLAMGRDGTDLILLDSPPLLPIADASVLAPLMDGVLLVVDLRKTPRGAARQARQQLDSIGARVLGVVVNAVPTRRGSYYYYYSQYYEADGGDAGTRSP